MPAVLKPLTLLVTGDEDGALVMSVGGLFPVARLQLDGPAAVAVACCASGDLCTLFVWAQTVNGPKLETHHVGFLATRQREVFHQDCVISIFPQTIPEIDIYCRLP